MCKVFQVCQDSIVGPFAWNNQIDYAHGMDGTEAMQLIDGVVASVKIYDSIEGAHFHEYTIMWDDPNDIFYVDNSITWLRGGIEDAAQDPNKYYEQFPDTCHLYMKGWRELVDKLFIPYYNKKV